ncbi:glycoside hydrolase family 31 protein [Caulobacter segnis]|uniref:glycoside hydrolase family 31 protein n=1 Tax=Caulobacter segnis TaxID=88688 RepID=UPI001CBDBE93|nr:glycoside hydrolase family 31 protein [Caulobacter segnis]UAL11516.1 glycoside hydrolase family 31 protein [Caulobacter segnis]
MRRRNDFGLITMAAAALILGTAGYAKAQSPAAVVTQKTSSGVEFRLPQGVLRLDLWSDNIVRVRFSADGAWTGTYNPAVIAQPRPGRWTIEEQGDRTILKTAALRVSVDRASGEILFLTADGQRILRAAAAGQDSTAGAPGQRFDLGAREAVYGLGQHQGGQLDYRGASVLLQQINTDVGVPMAVSSNGYGVLWNNPASTRVDVATPQYAHSLRFKSEAGGGVDYHFIYGPDIDQVVGGYRGLTGQAPLMARWTWGLWQSKERYQTQDETLSIVRRYRALGVPFDAVVQDWQYWSPGGWGSHQFDPARFPDPAGLVKAVHDLNARIIISVWPRFDLTTANHDELRKAGALFEPIYPNVYPEGLGRWYDAWSATGRAIYWKQIMRNLGRYGFDGWWLDGAEAELGGKPGQMAGLSTAAGPGAETFNSYPLLHTTAVHDGMRRDMPEKRAFILTRSAYAGQQRNAAITWSGDVEGNWDTLAKQVPAALNFSISGIPYWSADIGGFFGGDPQDPAYAELFTRWYQFGVFNPMFRVHGTGKGKELWAFAPEVQQRLIAYDKLRYRLLPYIYSTAWEVTQRAGTMMRPLVMDFRTDPNVLTLRDQYMFGRGLMVSPVIQKDADIRAVYLPKGDWYDFWTGTKMAGGKVVAVKADIDTIPVHVPAGTILPLGPVLSYADQPSQEPLEIRVYPGRDGQFELYDDAGDGYGYEKGERATTPLTWTDARHVLRVGARDGRFPGMKVTMALRVVCAPTGAASSVRYAGAALEVPLPDCR